MNPHTNDVIDADAGSICCIPFDPSTFYDNNENDFIIIHWDNKPFVKDGAYCWQVAGTDNIELCIMM